MPQSDYSLLEVVIGRARKCFQHPLLTSNFLRDLLSGYPPTLKLNLTLAQTPTPAPNLGGGGNFPRGAIVQIPKFLYFHSFINLANETIICIQKQILIFLIFKGQCKDQHLLFKIQITVKSYHKMQELLVFLKILKLPILH